MSGLSNVELWKRIQDYQFDKIGAELTFTQRLARENGWKLDFAERVVDEYKRFIYLTTIAKETLTPSEEVDQVWHLHLVYTRDYWQRFCKETLKRDLHHTPTEGGPDEQEKFRVAYRRTLDRYAAEFGNSPPADIWPGEALRFAHIGKRVTVDTGDMIIIARTAVRRAVKASGSALVGAAGLAVYSFLDHGFGMFLMLGAGAMLINAFSGSNSVSAEASVTVGGDGDGGGGDGGGGCGGGCG